jgi:hypothetical protein
MELAPALLAEQDVRDSESRCDQLADDHARLCSPWQAELSELEQAAISRVSRREAPDAEEDERRAELTKLIGTATSDLERAVAEEHDLQSVARRKARKIREGNPPGEILLMVLAKSPLANPRLLAELFVAKQRIAFATARIAAAKTGLKIAEGNLDGIRRNAVSGELAVHTHKANCWRAELAAGEAEQAEALAEAEKIHKAMIDE